MKLHYKGKFNLDVNSLPHEPHKPNAVPFKEFQDTKKFAIVINIIAAIVMVIVLIPVFLKFGFTTMPIPLIVSSLLSFVILFPHELLHAICFKKDVYLYTNLKQGSLFVVGTETMSKGRFIFMSLLPNIVFGFIPYIVGLLAPANMIWCIAGTFGALCIGSGAGDYYNVFNALTQMPKGSRTYLHKFNSFWYMPEDKED